MESEKDEMQLENLEEEKIDKVKEDKEESNESEEDPTCPMMRLTVEEKRQLCKPCKKLLIVKLLENKWGCDF